MKTLPRGGPGLAERLTLRFPGLILSADTDLTLHFVQHSAD